MNNLFCRRSSLLPLPTFAERELCVVCYTYSWCVTVAASRTMTFQLLCVRALWVLELRWKHHVELQPDREISKQIYSVVISIPSCHDYHGILSTHLWMISWLNSFFLYFTFSAAPPTRFFRLTIFFSIPVSLNQPEHWAHESHKSQNCMEKEIQLSSALVILFKSCYKL